MLALYLPAMALWISFLIETSFLEHLDVVRLGDGSRGRLIFRMDGSLKLVVEK
jgi:hypothetical protein